MRIRSRLLCALPAAALLLCALTVAVLWAGPETKITVVVKTLTGRPIDRAEVIVRWKADAKHPSAPARKATRLSPAFRRAVFRFR
jgi:hypothetical protein